MITYASINLILKAVDGGGGGTSSQSPAIVALIVGITSSIAAVYSIIRQSRGDRAAERAAATSVAAEASKQSFEQVMQMNTRLGERIITLEREAADREQKIDELEADLANADEDLGKSKRDNARLRRLVREHGGTP